MLFRKKPWKIGVISPTSSPYYLWITLSQIAIYMLLKLHFYSIYGGASFFLNPIYKLSTYPQALLHTTESINFINWGIFLLDSNKVFHYNLLIIVHICPLGMVGIPPD